MILFSILFIICAHKLYFLAGETLINFLKSLDSPFEITEYVNTYLGIGKVSRDFSKNFISKRSYLRNKDKGEQHEVFVNFCLSIFSVN